MTTIFSGEKKLLAKGHRIEGEDVLLLEGEALNEVWVAELEEGDVGEDDAVMRVASAMGIGSVEVRAAVGGRAKLFATEPCCVLVDSDLLKQCNMGDGLAIATFRNFSYARAGQRVSTVKSAPFVVTERRLESLMSLLAEKGPILQARPIRARSVAVLYCDPMSGDRALQLFGTIMGQRLKRWESVASPSLASVEEEVAVAEALLQLLRHRPVLVLIASTTAPAGPDDIVGRAMLRAGCQFEHFLAPVEPGALLLLGYNDDVPILSAPGCFRSAKPNILDLLLPPLLARYRLSSWEIASLGHGGLLD